MSTASVTVLADIRKYTEELSKIPGVTDKAAAAAAIKLEQRMTRAQAEAAKAAAKAASQVSGAAASGADHAKDAIEALHKSSEATGGALGVLTRPLGDAGDLMTALGPAGAAGAIGLAAVVSAGIGVISMSIDMARRLEEVRDEARDLGIVLREDQVAALSALDDALTGTDGAWLRLTATLSSEASPVIAAATDVLTGLLTVLTPTGGAGAASGVIWAVDTLATGLRITNTFLGPAAALAQDLVHALRALGIVEREEAAATALKTRAADAALDVIQRQIEAEDELRRAQRGIADRDIAGKAAEAERAAEKAAAEAERRAEERAAATQQLQQIEEQAYAARLTRLEQLEFAYDLEMKKIADLERRSGSHTQAEEARAETTIKLLRDTAAARDAEAASFMAGVEKQRRDRDRDAEDRAHATRDLEQIEQQAHASGLSRMEEIRFAYDLRMQKIDALEEKSGDHAQAQRSRDETTLEYLRKIAAETDALAEAAKAAARARTAADLASMGTLVGAAQLAADAIIATYDTQTEAGRAAALKAFQTSKGFALADVAVKTAQAIMSAFTLPPLAIPFAVVAATAAGATQAGVIIAQQPTFHAGYWASRMHGDEVQATVRKDEVVIPAPTVFSAGGPEEVRRRVEQPDGGGPEHLILDFGDRRVMMPLRRAVARGMSASATSHWSRRR